MWDEFLNEIPKPKAYKPKGEKKLIYINVTQAEYELNPFRNSCVMDLMDHNFQAVFYNRESTSYKDPQCINIRRPSYATCQRQIKKGNI